MKRKALPWILVVLAGGLLSGCNMLSFTAGDNDDTYVVKGQDALRDANFDQAIEDFSKALEKNPNNAEAHWGRAKAYVRSTGHNTIELLTELSDFEDRSGAPLPFMDELAWPDVKASALLRAIELSRLDLKAIYEGQASSPELNRDTIGLDYATCLAIGGLLNVRDVDRDGRITSSDPNIFLAMVSNPDASTSCRFGGEWDNLTVAERTRVAQSVKTLINAGADVLAVVLSDVLDLQLEPGADFTPDQKEEIQDSLGFDAANMDELIDKINAATDPQLQP